MVYVWKINYGPKNIKLVSSISLLHTFKDEIVVSLKRFASCFAWKEVLIYRRASFLLSPLSPYCSAMLLSRRFSIRLLFPGISCKDPHASSPSSRFLFCSTLPLLFSFSPASFSPAVRFFCFLFVRWKDSCIFRTFLSHYFVRVISPHFGRFPKQVVNRNVVLWMASYPTF